MTFDQLIDSYGLHLQGLRRSPATCKNFLTCARGFHRHCQTLDVLEPHQVQERHLVSYTRWMQDQQRSPMSIYSRQRSLRTWFAWATLRGHLLLDPFKNFAPPRHPPILGRSAPSLAEVRAMLCAPSPDHLDGRRDRALFEFLYGTGLRSQECCRVDVDHVDLKGLVLHVHHGKGGHPRQLPLGPHLAQILTTYLQEIRPGYPKADPAPLFVSPRNRRLSGHSLQAYVTQYTAALGLKGFTTHSFRHAYATHMLLHGAPLVALQRLLGHQTLQMTARYAHLVPRDVQDELLRTHPRGRRKPRGPSRPTKT